MRNFDNRQCSLDTNGKVFRGRYRFCNLDDTPANVYSASGVSLGSEVATDASGRTISQVFLADQDYIVYMDRYVGWGDMPTTEEEIAQIEASSWRTINSFVSKDTIVTPESQVFSCIDTIADLKASSLTGTIALLGYYQKFDKPMVFYTWQPSSVATEDGGSVIAKTGVTTGRWLLNFTEKEIDVRHFGAFPNTEWASDASQRGKIQMAKAFQDSLSTDNEVALLFPSVKIAGQSYIGNTYDIEGLELWHVNADQVTFYNGNSAATATATIGDLRPFANFAGTGYFEIYGDAYATGATSKTAFFNGVITCRGEDYVKATNCTIVVTGTGDAADTKFEGTLDLTNCNVVSEGYISNATCSFTNMAVSDRWFDTTAHFLASGFTNCTVDLKNIKDPYAYLMYNLNKHETAIVMDNRAIYYQNLTQIPAWYAGQSLTLKNVKFVGSQGLMFRDGMTITMENCDLRVDQGHSTYFVDNCRLVIVEDALTWSLTANNSTITGLCQYLTTASFTNCVFGSNIKVGAMAANGTKFLGSVESYNLEATDCYFNAIVNIKDNASALAKIKARGCSFGTNSYVNLTSWAHDEVSITCELIGNTFAGAIAIDVQDVYNSSTGKYGINPSTLMHTFKAIGNKNFKALIDDVPTELLQEDNSIVKNGVQPLITTLSETAECRTYTMPVFGFGQSINGGVLSMLRDNSQAMGSQMVSEVYPYSDTTYNCAMVRNHNQLNLTKNYFNVDFNIGKVGTHSTQGYYCIVAKHI